MHCVMNSSPKMKSIFCLTIVSLAVTAYGLTPEQQEKVKAYFAECLSSTGANADAVHKSRQGQFVDDPKIAEFVFCFYKMVGFMNDAGEVQSDVIRAKLTSTNMTPADVNTVIEKCSSVTGKDNNEKAYNIYKCYWNATPNHVNLTD